MILQNLADVFTSAFSFNGKLIHKIISIMYSGIRVTFFLSAVSIITSLITKKSIAMKNVIVAVLLIAATGAGVYFLFFNKKKSGIAGNEIQKELIVGKWKLDSLLHVKDSVELFAELATMIDPDFKNYTYQFRRDGKVLRLLKDNVQKDSSRYEWTKEDYLLFKEQFDSIGTNFIVSKLSRDSLVLQSKDSSIAYFTRLK